MALMAQKACRGLPLIWRLAKIWRYAQLKKMAKAYNLAVLSLIIGVSKVEGGRIKKENKAILVNKGKYQLKETKYQQKQKNNGVWP